MASTTLKKSARIEIRLSQEEKDIIVRAAQSLGQDLSSFFLGTVLPKAKETIMFDTAWMQNKESVEHFMEILNQDAGHFPALAKLLQKENNETDNENRTAYAQQIITTNPRYKK